MICSGAHTIWIDSQRMCVGGRPRPRAKSTGLPRQVASAASADPSPLPPAAAAASSQPGHPSAAGVPAESAYESLLQGILQSRLADAAAAAEAAAPAQESPGPHAGAGPASQSSSMPPSAASADEVRSLLPEQDKLAFQMESRRPQIYSWTYDYSAIFTTEVWDP